MQKRRKHNLKKRRQFTYLLCLLIIFMIIVGPWVWHIEQLGEAKNAYNIQKVNEELRWLEGHGGLLNKFSLITDAKLWLELNVGSQDLESKLTKYQDDQHRFWLFLLHLQDGKMTEAQSVIGPMSGTTLGQLGQALMSLAQGDAEGSRRLLTDSEFDWMKLPRQEQTLRHLTLAQAAMISGDHQSTKVELEAARGLESNNPACLSMAFDIAIEEGQWAKALELSQSIGAQTWRPKTTLFETKKAVFAIHENNLQVLSDSLASLKELLGGEACINYVNGIRTINKGQLQEGKNLLEHALNSGLDGGLKADAQKAVEQITERQKADKALRSIAEGNAE